MKALLVNASAPAYNLGIEKASSRRLRLMRVRQPTFRFGDGTTSLAGFDLQKQLKSVDGSGARRLL